MSALAAHWFEDDEPRDLARWSVAAAVVVGLHAAAVAGYLLWHQPVDLGDDAGIVTVELAPSDSDVDQPEIVPEPEAQPKPVEEQPPPPPPEVSTDVAALPEPKVVEEEKKPPPPPPTPPRSKSSATNVTPSWQSSLVRHLQRYKRYPSEALQKAEEGVVVLSFSLDRSGHVLDRRIARSSGYAELDQEVMALIVRAQPLPPFPADMPQARVDLTVPIRFSMH